MWPWSKIKALELQIKVLSTELAREKSAHKAALDQVKFHVEQSQKNQGHLRKMAQIIALKGGIL